MKLATLIAASAECGRTLAWQSSLDDRIVSLTPEEVLAAVRRRLSPEKLTIVKAGDFAGSSAR